LDEVDYSYFLEYSKDELAHALINYIQCEQDYLSKIKSLKKIIHDLLFEKEVFQKSNNEAQSKIETLENEKEELQSKCEGLEKMMLKFFKGQDNLDKLLGSQRMSFKKEGIWFNAFNKKGNLQKPLCSWGIQKGIPHHMQLLLEEGSHFLFLST